MSESDPRNTDDGTLDNWMLLARVVTCLAAADYIALSYPDLAIRYLRNWKRCDPQTCIDTERDFLCEFWNDGGGEFALWVGLSDLPSKLSRVVKTTRIGNRRLAMRRTIYRAFQSYATARPDSMSKKKKCAEQVKYCLDCGKEICPESLRCRKCASIEREHNRIY